MLSADPEQEIVNPFDPQSSLSTAKGTENVSKISKESHPITTFSLKTTEAGGPRSQAQAKIKTYSSDPSRPRFPRISRAVELLRPSYDVVVM